MKFVKTLFLGFLALLLIGGGSFENVFAKNYLTSVSLTLNDGSPITTVQNIRLSLWSDGRLESGDITGAGAINTSASKYANYNMETTRTPDGLGRLKIALSILSGFPQTTHENQFLMVEYKDDGDPDTNYTVYTDTYINNSILDRFPLVENGPDIFESVYTNDATGADTFILDQDDSVSTGTIDLQFGSTLSEFLQYDVDNTRFVFTDDVRIEGNLATVGEMYIADDHAATDSNGTINLGVNNDIWQTLIFDSIGDIRFELSNDLSLEGNELQNFYIENLTSAPTCDGTSIGRVYYDTTDSFTYICDGTSFNPLENVLGSTIQFPAVQSRRTTSFTLTTTFTDITLDTTDIENNTDIIEHDNTNTDRILIKETGLYQIIYSFIAGATATSTHEALGRVRINDATVLTESSSYNKNFQGEYSTTSSAFLAELTDGDFVSLQLARDAVADDTQGDIFFSVVKLEGLKGDKGDQGLPGSVGLGTNETTFTLDQDNVSTGVDVDLIAEQGTDNDGILRYNATTNRWEFSNDGGSFQSIASAPDVAQVYESGTTTFNAVTPIDWDGASATSRIVDAAYTHSTAVNPSRVTVANAGLYEIAYNISWDTTANARRTASCAFYVNGVTVNPAVGTTHAYSRNNTDDFESNSATFLYNFAANDYYEVQCSSTGTNGNITTLANQSSTVLKRIR